MNYLKEKYINIISGRLRNFQKKRQGLYNFSCSICGDSQKNERKARAYFFEKNSEIFFVCHNCNAPIGSFENFLKQFDSFLYADYIREKIFPQGKVEEVSSTRYAVVDYDHHALNKLKSIIELASFDAMRIYVESRKIPVFFLDKLYDCQNFKKFTNNLLPDMFSASSLKYEERRMLIPFFDEKKEMFAYSGRSIDKFNDLRYINITLDKNKEKIFGLDRWKKSELTYVVEGPIDSMFLNNAVATAGGNLISYFKEYDKEKIIIVFDNEKRSSFTREKMKKAIDQGFRVCLWPNSNIEKDINAMILAGISSEKIEEMIKTNSYSGLKAKLEFKFWN